MGDHLGSIHFVFLSVCLWLAGLLGKVDNLVRFFSWAQIWKKAPMQLHKMQKCPSLCCFDTQLDVKRKHPRVFSLSQSQFLHLDPSPSQIPGLNLTKLSTLIPVDLISKIFMKKYWIPNLKMLFLTSQKSNKWLIRGFSKSLSLWFGKNSMQFCQNCQIFNSRKKSFLFLPYSVNLTKANASRKPISWKVDLVIYLPWEVQLAQKLWLPIVFSLLVVSKCETSESAITCITLPNLYIQVDMC